MRCNGLGSWIMNPITLTRSRGSMIPIGMDAMAPAIMIIPENGDTKSLKLLKSNMNVEIKTLSIQAKSIMKRKTMII